MGQLPVYVFMACYHLTACVWFYRKSFHPSIQGRKQPWKWCDFYFVSLFLLFFFFTVVKVYDIIYRKPEKWCNDLCFCLAECLEGCVLPIRGCDVNVWWLKRCLWCPVSCLLTQPRGSRNNKDLKAGVKILLGKSTLKYTFERLVLLLYVNSATRKYGDDGVV